MDINQRKASDSTRRPRNPYPIWKRITPLLSRTADTPRLAGPLVRVAIEGLKHPDLPEHLQAVYAKRLNSSGLSLHYSTVISSYLTTGNITSEKAQILLAEASADAAKITRILLRRLSYDTHPDDHHEIVAKKMNLDILRRSALLALRKLTSDDAKAILCTMIKTEDLCRSEGILGRKLQMKLLDKALPEGLSVIAFPMSAQDARFRNSLMDPVTLMSNPQFLEFIRTAGRLKVTGCIQSLERIADEGALPLEMRAEAINSLLAMAGIPTADNALRALFSKLGESLELARDGYGYGSNTPMNLIGLKAMVPIDQINERLGEAAS